MKKIILFSLIFFFLSFSFTKATIRYVSHNSTPTPPYTTWETAADSIQKCIDYSFDGDTIIVANGTYYESLVVNKYLSLIGSSMDSTIIDGTGLANSTINFEEDGFIKNFFIKGKGQGISQTSCLLNYLCDVYVKNCRLVNALEGVTLVWSSSIINQCFIMGVAQGYSTYCSIDTCNPQIENSVILINNSLYAGINIGTGKNIANKNNILGGSNSYYGVGISFSSSKNIIKNNVVSGFNKNVDGFADDSATVYNNISSYASGRGYTLNSKTDMRNNISAYNAAGVVGPTSTNSDYNLYWQNNTNTTEGLSEHDIVADPMFVNDTIPVYGGGYDYHLQKYSPAIDAGDPNILDVDGSRSDIGVFGGPGGEMYTYLDLAPKPPANLTAVYDSGLVKLKWDKNTEADLFRYRVYRDTVANFIYDTTKIIAVTADTFYFDDLPEKYLAGNYYYKITAIDSAYHQSAASEEVNVKITGAPEGPPIVVEEYKLLHNYPNPFNPSTRIPYRLKDGGYVKLLIYDIKGELLRVLVNEYQNAGYYEVEFAPRGNEIERGKLPEAFETGYRGDIASGIYLYRIEVIGEGKIPRFVDMGKMIYVK